MVLQGSTVPGRERIPILDLWGTYKLSCCGSLWSFVKKETNPCKDDWLNLVIKRPIKYQSTSYSDTL